MPAAKLDPMFQGTPLHPTLAAIPSETERMKYLIVFAKFHHPHYWRLPIMEGRLQRDDLYVHNDMLNMVLREIQERAVE